MLPSADVPQGPYRATKLWNEVVRVFRCGMPTKRHWYQFKVFYDTFSGAEATDWLHDCLKHNNNFGTQVTKEQTIRLLCKFLKNHVIEDVSGKWGSEDVTDNKQLYRFPQGVSPSKAIRQPLALLDTNMASPRRENIAIAKKKFIQQSRMMKKNSSLKTFTSIWHRAYLSSLQQILNLKSIDEIMPCGILEMEWLVHNSTKDELSTFTEHEMPYWVISAMQCLATWPNSESSGLPSYPGFEKDIFAAVCGYFQALSEPLVTHNLYQQFITVFARSEKLHIMSEDEFPGKQQGSPESECNGEEEVEKLRRRLMQAQMRHANKAIRHRKSMRHGALPTKYLNFNEVEVPSSNRLSTWEWGLNDEATRETWTDRFSSFQKLDQLVEEKSILEQSKRENFASLPELRFSTLPRRSANSGSHADFEPKQLRNGKVYNYNQAEFKDDNTLADVEKSASVENLLLDMSYRMQTEMENELMKDSPQEFDDQPETEVKGHSKGYGNLSFEERDVMQSPMYQTMKPIFQKNKIVAPSMRYQKSSSVKKCRSFHARENYSTNLNKEDVYMEISASQPSLNVRIKPNPSSLTSLQETGMSTSTLPRSSKARRSIIKPSIEDLENDLMFSPYVKSTNYVKRNDVVKMERKERILQPHYPRNNPPVPRRPRSDIIERREVPPPCATKPKTIDSNLIQKRLERLPYVSQSMKNTGPLNAVSQPNIGLSRSNSTLTHRPQRDLRQKSSTQQTTLSQRRGWNNNNLSLASAKSCNNFIEAFAPHDQPPSPLTTAFDTARSQANPLLDASSCIIESLQLCLLLLPPSNRSKLRLLLRLIVKMCDNPHLADLHDLMPTRSYVLQELSPCIIRHSKIAKTPPNKEMEEKIVNIFLDYTSIILSKPLSLEVAVKEMSSRQTKSQSCINTAGLNMEERAVSLKRQSTFCKQISVVDYEKQRRKNLEQSLSKLLHDIVHDENMAMKEKRKKLKQFQKSYPEIYYAAYPDTGPILERRSSSGRKKPMFSTAIKRLRSLRL